MKSEILHKKKGSYGDEIKRKSVFFTNLDGNLLKILYFLNKLIFLIK